MKFTKGLVALVIISILILSVMQTPAFGHRNGCHRWHSCPSDHGTYECGDTGHCSECSDNNYCKAGEPISVDSSGYSTNSPSGSSSSPGTSSSSGATSSSNTTSSSSSLQTSIPPKQDASVPSTQVTPTCDATFWTHVYHPQRLKVIDPCKTVSGVIKSIKKEQDGDYHIQLKLDSQFSNLINSANIQYQHGYLVLEPVCQGIVTQGDAKSACVNFKSTLTIPQKGSHVMVTGSYVLDLQHDNWAEIHPISNIKIMK